MAGASKKRIVILGGGFGGVYTARHLERLFKRRSDVEILLVSRDNFLLMTPLLFEVFSGTLDIRQCSFPVRAFLKATRFVEATVQSIDLENREVQLEAGGERRELAYDQLVLALGAMTNRVMIPGSEHAFTFKTLADALLLRTHVIECLERADVETDQERKRRLLTFAIIGGGLVGVELFGELTAFVDGILPLYKRVNREELSFVLLQYADRIMPEIDPSLADYAARVLGLRCGADIRTHAFRRRLGIAKETSLSTVVWNPWVEKAKALSDFGDAEWMQMVCIETCNVGNFAVELAPGEQHTMQAIVWLAAK